MPEFMQHRLSDFCPDVVFGSADGLDGLLVDGDAVRQCQVVMVPPLGEGYALVEAEEEPTPADTRPFAITGGGSPLNDDIDVFDAAQQVSREGRHSLPYERAEASWLDGQAWVGEAVQSVLNPVPRMASCSILCSSAISSARVSSALRTAST